MQRFRSNQDPRGEAGDGIGKGHPSVKFRRLFWGLVLMPTVVGLAWSEATSFNPYTASFFTKTYIAPSPGFPGEMRVAGWVIVAIGAVLGIVSIRGLAKKHLRFTDDWPVLLFAFLLMALGEAFFVAAQSAQFHIDQRTNVRMTEPPSAPDRAADTPRLNGVLAEIMTSLGQAH